MLSQNALWERLKALPSDARPLGRPGRSSQLTQAPYIAFKRKVYFKQSVLENFAQNILQISKLGPQLFGLMCTTGHVLP